MRPLQHYVLGVRNAADTHPPLLFSLMLLHRPREPVGERSLNLAPVHDVNGTSTEAHLCKEIRQAQVALG